MKPSRSERANSTRQQLAMPGLGDDMALQSPYAPQQSPPYGPGLATSAPLTPHIDSGIITSQPQARPRPRQSEMSSSRLRHPTGQDNPPRVWGQHPLPLQPSSRMGPPRGPGYYGMPAAASFTAPAGRTATSIPLRGQTMDIPVRSTPDEVYYISEEDENRIEAWLGYPLPRDVNGRIPWFTRPPRNFNALVAQAAKQSMASVGTNTQDAQNELQRPQKAVQTSLPLADGVGVLRHSAKYLEFKARQRERQGATLAPSLADQYMGGVNVRAAEGGRKRKADEATNAHDMQPLTKKRKTTGVNTSGIRALLGGGFLPEVLPGAGVLFGAVAQGRTSKRDLTEAQKEHLRKFIRHILK